MTPTLPPASATPPRVLVLQHMASDGPGYLGTWLRRHGIGMDCIDSSSGRAFPDSLGDWAAVAVLGGEMSVHDDLPDLRRAEALIRQAVAAGRPVIGHCLGGQLMATALGGSVGRSPRPELGWHAVTIDAGPEAHAWFGDAASAHVFQWHGEAFSLPPGARRLAGNAACPNQAFALGPHLAMQFHVEVDAAKLRDWFAASDDPEVREVARALEADPAGASSKLAAQQALADRLYTRWWRAAMAVAEAA